MSEYIIREEVFQKLHDAGGCGATEEWAKGYDDGITEAIRIINEMPAADVAPVVRGHRKWCARAEGYMCSVCGEGVYKTDKYCSECGAKMDENEEKEI